MHLRLWALGVVVGLFGLVGCGGGPSLSDGDAEVVKTFVTGVADWFPAIAGLSSCDVNDGCRPARPRSAAVATRRAASEFQFALRGAQNSCLRAAGARIAGAMQAYAKYADDVAVGAEKPALKELDAGDAAYYSGIDRLIACKLLPRDGAAVTFNLQLRAVDSSAVGMEKCADLGCAARFGRKIRLAADRALRLVSPMVTDLDGCIRTTFEKGLELLRVYRHLGSAAVNGDLVGVQSAANGTVLLRQQMTRLASSCADSLHG